jgi:hypothetical protein
LTILGAAVFAFSMTMNAGPRLAAPRRELKRRMRLDLSHAPRGKSIGAEVQNRNVRVRSRHGMSFQSGKLTTVKSQRRRTIQLKLTARENYGTK